MRKRFIYFLLCLVIVLALFGCRKSGPNVSEKEPGWSIYWYLCGSDLESDGGLATKDLQEMLEVDLPSDCQVVIQTGGAEYWNNDIINADMAQRYVYNSEGLTLIEEFDKVNMGEAETLEDFLNFATKNYPTLNTMVLFWNHGGGSTHGVAFDEQFAMDSLTLDEMREAFTAVVEPDAEDPPFDIIGFDACLMATVDVANVFKDLGSYLVASEELVPGIGWYYTGWLNEIADDSSISPLDVAISICDTYIEKCTYYDVEDCTTLSVTNLSKVDSLIEAYDNFGKEALLNAIENPSFLAYFAQVSNDTENYGGNSKEQGYTNMLDLGHLAMSFVDILPQSAPKVVESLSDCIEYKVNGEYRTNSNGLACYYSYNSDESDLTKFNNVGASDAFKHYFSYCLTGTIDRQGKKYLKHIGNMDYDLIDLNELNDIDTLEEDVNWDNHKLTLDDKGRTILDLGKNAKDILATITYQIHSYNVEDDTLSFLGTDSDITVDWETGVFRDNFRNVWGSIDGHICHMNVVYQCVDYHEFVVPIFLNGEAYNLCVNYDFDDKEFYILGARRRIDETGAADKNLITLQKGDIIEIVHYVSPLSDEDAPDEVVVTDKIEFTDNTKFCEIRLAEGEYVFSYVMEDVQGNVSYSEDVFFEIVKEGKIITSH